MTHKERAGYLHAIAGELGRAADEHGQIWAMESGVVTATSRPRVGLSAGKFEFYAGLAETFLFQEVRKPSRT